MDPAGSLAQLKKVITKNSDVDLDPLNVRPPGSGSP